MKRSMFEEISEGFDALSKERIGKVTLRDRKSTRLNSSHT